MKASEKLLLRYLEGADKNFIIPVYQRNYDWKEKQCTQLYDDLISIVNNNYRTHFLGSLVSIYSDNGNQEYLVIDGQQRLTTINLLLLALHNFIIDNSVDVKHAIPQKIYEEYLINKYAQGERKIRLKPVKNDNEAFTRLFTDDDNIEDSNVTKNYKYFYNRISLQEVSCDELFNAIQKLIVVDIELKKGEDDPQLIFESLNSTGLNLSQADLVRNYILMKESPKNQNIFYDKYWQKIEVNTLYKTDNFIRDYLTYKTSSIPNKGNVYIAFKKFVENIAQEEDFNTEDFLKELLKFSKYYYVIISGKAEDIKTSELLNEINKLDITVSFPFLLEVFEDVDKNIISNEDLNLILNFIISYSFRRAICEVPTNALNKIFMTLGREIKKQDNYEENYIEIFKYNLIQKRGSQRFPNDEEFVTKLKVKDVYNMQSKNKYHLFKYLETYDNKEKIDVDNLLDQKDLSIEHIMPQTLTIKWKEELGEDYEQVYAKYLNTIGNLTLTGYNSKYSNLSFYEKKTIEKGFNESSLYLNSFLKNIQTWNKFSIKERADILANRSVNIWKYPSSIYSPTVVLEENCYLLSEDLDLTGEKIYQFEIMGSKYKVDSWKDFLDKMFLVLYDLDSNLLFNLVRIGFSNRLSDSAENHTTPIKIAENIYVESNLSTSSILLFISKVIKQYQLEDEDVMLYIRKKTLL